MTKNNKGFSIIELMVVIAIIGVLATIAVPNFQKFQAKAKQTNAKVELTGIYTAEQAFFTEFGTYHTDLASIGYIPDGIDGTAATAVPAGLLRYYNVGFANATSPGTFAALTLPVSPAAGGHDGWYRATASLCAQAAPASIAGTGVLAGPAMAADGQTFVASAEGCPRSLNFATKDQWAISEQKILANVQSGI